MAAINTTSYRFGKSNLDAAASPEVVTLDGGEVRTLQVLVPNGTLRPIDPDTATTIPLSEIRGPANEPLLAYPETDAVGEWNFCLIGYPVCHLGVTGPEAGAVEKVFENVASATAIAQLIAQGFSTSTFNGTVDWNTQVTNKPAIPATAADVGALATTTRGATDGVAPLTGLLIPFSFLPVGATSTTVARGDHTHAGSYDILPANTTVRITESAAGVYPAPPTPRADIIRVFRGSVQPTPAQGWRDGDEWINGVFAP